MTFSKVFIPYGGYWSTPFCRWQGSLAQEHSMKLLANTTSTFLDSRQTSAENFDSIVLGYTVTQRHDFYGAPWVAAMIGAPELTGPSISQACATSARVLAVAAEEIETEQGQCILGLTCDRTSNGPHILYPNPGGFGGKGEAEDPVWDNFNYDPYAKNSMIETAENVAREVGITREEQDAVGLLRYEQYQEALADDRTFQRRYMVPAEVRRGKKTVTIDADEGVFPTTKDGLAKLKPVLEGGTVTFGTQTHPADGNAGMIVTTEGRAQRLSRDRSITIQLLGFGSSRAKKGYMGMAVVPAARRALEQAGVKIQDVTAIKTHNPFAVNDIYFSKELNVPVEKLNRFGSPLIYGHPQGPTGTRVIIELIEELVLQGGGYGLFSGCAGGDTAMAVVLKVD